MFFYKFSLIFFVIFYLILIKICVKEFWNLVIFRKFNFLVCFYCRWDVLDCEILMVDFIGNVVFISKVYGGIG